MAVLLAGCTSSIPVTPPAQTATQQLIVSASETKALATLPRLLPPRLAYVDAANFTGGKYEMAAFKAWLLAQGVPLTDTEKSAQMIVAPFAAVDSYNVKSLLLGIPALRITALLQTPEIAAYADATEIAINQIAFYAYDAKTGVNVAQATSKYGIQPYSVEHLLFFFTTEYPKLAQGARAY